MSSKILSENLRKHYAMKYFNDNYFIAVYSKSDEYIFSLETLQEASKYFNISVSKILEKLRQDSFIIYKGVPVKLYLVKKEKNIESRGKRK